MKMTIKEFASKYFNIILPTHQKSWIRWLDKAGPLCMLLAPRGHGKTTVISLIYICWMIVHNPKINILLVSHNKDQAEEFSRSVRLIFEREDIQEDFAVLRGNPWRANSWTLKGTVAGKPTLRVVGAMGGMTGWRGDVVIFDDLLEIKSIQSAVIRTKVTNWIKGAVYPALDPGPNQRVIVVGTRKHIDDWYGELLINPEFKCRVDRAYKKNGQPLWPERFPKEELESIRRKQGPIYFAQEMMNRPSPIEGNLFKSEWLQFFEHLPPHGHIKYYMGIDPSYGSTLKRATYFSLCVVAYDTINDKIYVVDLYRSKLSQEAQVQKAIEYANKYKIEEMYIESVFSYNYVYKQMKSKYHNVHPIDYIHTKLKGTAVVKKEERITNICGPAIELGRVLFKKPELDPFTKVFLNEEYRAFPFGHMDMFDALTLAIDHLIGGQQITEVPFWFPGYQ